MYKTIPKPLREKVWRKDNKNIQSICPICNQNEITAFNFECGHILAESKGGTLTIDNLRAICGSCNKSMGTRNMDEFKDFICGKSTVTNATVTNTNETNRNMIKTLLSDDIYNILSSR